MPSLLERLRGDLTQAMRARDDLRLQTLRMTIAAVTNARIASGAEPADAEVEAIVRRGIKTRREAAEQFRAGAREELALKEEKEIAILEGYLPALLGEAEAAAAIDAILAEMRGAAGGTLTRRDMGRVMKEVQARLGGRVDGKAAAALVTARLSQA